MLNALYGIRVVVTPDAPRMQLSEDCPVTPDFRAEMNAWMVGFFGVVNTLKDNEVMHDKINDVIYMNPRTQARVSAALKSGAAA